ncbi:toll-like receptor 4, partial [Saccostrea cucullata]|uniref:toll-like receptor 4 n=1 Tax=Saccostrea cuccullata TaxID=36930 RepID=UPI002ED6675C
MTRLYLRTLVVTFFLATGMTELQCSSEPSCQCLMDNDRLYADCSHLNLTESPVFSPNVKIINLSHNKLTCLPLRESIPDGLVHLDLSYNFIFTISGNSFQGMRNLTKLLLQNNKLRMQNQSHTQGIFKDLKNIQIIDLSYNTKLTFKVLRSLSFDLQNTSIRILRLNKIHCTFGMGTKILVKDFKFLLYTELIELHLDSNRIEMIEDTAIRYLPKTIKFISVSDNKFTFGKYVCDVSYLEHMQKINISAQHLGHPVNEINTCNESLNDSVPYCASKYDPNFEKALGSVHVNSKDHTINMNTKFKGRRSSEVLNSSSDVMSRKVEDQCKNYMEDQSVFHIVFLNERFIFPVPKALQVIYANSSNLRFKIFELHFSNNNITHFYLQDNAFYSWDGPVHNLNSIKVLNLSNNFCSHVSENFFQYAGSLTELYLGNNILGFSLASDMKGLIFRNLRKLEILDLKENRISTLRKTVFQKLVNLKCLDLSKNFLKAWEINTIYMKIVDSIDLSNNEITSLSDGDMKAFYRLGKIYFLHFDNYNCTEDAEHDGKVLKFDKIKSHILNLQRECRSYTAIIFVTTGTLVCFLFILCTGLAYRYRWKLRYFYYMTKSRYHQYKSLRNENLPLNQYDAFVSYADEDRSFVLRMIKELEEEEGIKLCIHQRDFVPGFDIAENIITAVNKSRKTIILISPNFIKSSWCMYELHIAKMEEIYSRNDENVIFLILYETLPLKDIPLTLMDLINQKTYIEFPNGDHDQEFSDD